MDPDDLLRRAYARLLSLRDNLPEGRYVSEYYVEEFHGALFDLECLDHDVVPFHRSLTRTHSPPALPAAGAAADAKDTQLETAEPCGAPSRSVKGFIAYALVMLIWGIVDIRCENYQLGGHRYRDHPLVEGHTHYFHVYYTWHFLPYRWIEKGIPREDVRD